VKSLLAVSTMLLLCSMTSALAEEGIIIQLAPVHAEASSTSDRVGRLEAGTKVSVFERQGGWKLIFSDQKSLTGWIRSHHVRSGYYAEAPKVESEPDSRGFLGGLASFSRSASSFFGLGGSDATPNTDMTATIGVRGLSEEEIKTAVPDFEELEKLNRFASDTQRMSAFASEGQLATSHVAYFEEIKPTKEKNEK
jgi:hypothetical protein